MPVLLSAMQLVVRLQPDEAIYLKMIVKRPGAVVKLQEGWGRRVGPTARQSHAVPAKQGKTAAGHWLGMPAT